MFQLQQVSPLCYVSNDQWSRILYITITLLFHYKWYHSHFINNSFERKKMTYYSDSIKM